ncbi:MAG: nucleoside triphosphate pyrophosphohydrolase [Acidimicrobiaceae bacterium]|nr:nucleoside triphosphate pyrophosphohydrolase [Acidimicrobiaceae bacterium]
MTAQITIVGLGPGSLGSVNTATLQAIEKITTRFVRTTRHPTAHLVAQAVSFDDEYERHETFEAVYTAIAKRLADEAHKHGEILYAVPGSPLVLEQTVQHLLNDKTVEITLVPAMSFLDIAWNELQIDPVDASVRLVDGHRFADLAAGERGPLLVAQCHAQWVLSNIKLANESALGDEPVVILHHLGLEDQRVIHTTWENFDREIEPDHLTTLYIPQLAEPIAGEMARLHVLSRRLREQCPWDREQTHDSLVRYLLEETYEVVDAINALDVDDPSTDEALIDELGDLLYQVEFHATIAEQQGRFSIADVARSIHDKLVRRHPHIFTNTDAESTEDVLVTWESIKQKERAGKTAKSVFAGVAAAAPSLMYASKLQKRAAEHGFDWPNSDGAYDKIAEELAELRQAVREELDPQKSRMELGDVLFSVVNLSRHLGIDAEVALRLAAEKFKTRFEDVVKLAEQRNLDLSTSSLEQLDALWNEIKKNEMLK